MCEGGGREEVREKVAVGVADVMKQCTNCISLESTGERERDIMILTFPGIADYVTSSLENFSFSQPFMDLLQKKHIHT